MKLPDAFSSLEGLANQAIAILVVQEEVLVAAGKTRTKKDRDPRDGRLRTIELGMVSRAVDLLMPRGECFEREMFDQYAMPGARSSVKKGGNPTIDEYFDSLVQLGSITEEERAAQEGRMGRDVPGVIRTWPTGAELTQLLQQQAGFAAGTVATPRKKKKQKKERPEGRCAVCAKSTAELAEGEKLRKCSKCETVHYCGADCQRADWKEHKKVCGK